MARKKDKQYKKNEHLEEDDHVRDVDDVRNNVRGDRGQRERARS